MKNFNPNPKLRYDFSFVLREARYSSILCSTGPRFFGICLTPLSPTTLGACVTVGAGAMLLVLCKASALLLLLMCGASDLLLWMAMRFSAR